jgi:glyoxylase-like metal-dependent hydrolase (beta-lactamase superfamily II)
MSNQLSFKRSMAFRYGEPTPIRPGIVRIVANNPNVFTFKGTNTYIVGMTSLAVIDPGPDDPAHREAILKTAGPRPITHIFTTHSHRDHVDGALPLKAATGAKILSFSGRGGPGGTASSPSGMEFVNGAFAPDVPLADGDVIDGKEWKLATLHTPGHAPDHVCYALVGRGVLFSGDHVMVWNTTVIAPPEGRMADYVRSLELLLGRKETLYLPGHGGRLDEPSRTVKAYLLHRRWREESILDAIRSGAGTIQKIVPLVYPEIDPRLSSAASLSVLAHVEHLIERGLVTCEGAPNWKRPLSLA